MPLSLVTALAQVPLHSVANPTLSGPPTLRPCRNPHRVGIIANGSHAIPGKPTCALIAITRSPICHIAVETKAARPNRGLPLPSCPPCADYSRSKGATASWKGVRHAGCIVSLRLCRSFQCRQTPQRTSFRDAVDGDSDRRRPKFSWTVAGGKGSPRDAWHIRVEGRGGVDPQVAGHHRGPERGSFCRLAGLGGDRYSRQGVRPNGRDGIPNGLRRAITSGQGCALWVFWVGRMV
jgi:hypothetical protein